MAEPIVADKPTTRKTGVLGKGDLTKFAKKLGKEADYAINFIVQFMKDEENDKKERMKAATWVVDKTVGIVKEVDRQTELAKKLELLDKNLKDAGVESETDSEGLTPRPAAFTLNIV